MFSLPNGWSIDLYSQLWFIMIVSNLYQFDVPLYLISLSIPRGQYLLDFNPWFLDFLDSAIFLWAFAQAWDSYLLFWIWSHFDLMSRILYLFCPDVFPFRPHVWVVLWSHFDLTLQLHSLTTCVPVSTTHFSKRLFLFLLLAFVFEFIDMNSPQEL